MFSKLYRHSKTNTRQNFTETVSACLTLHETIERQTRYASNSCRKISRTRSPRKADPRRFGVSISRKTNPRIEHSPREEITVGMARETTSKEAESKRAKDRRNDEERIISGAERVCQAHTRRRRRYDLRQPGQKRPFSTKRMNLPVSSLSFRSVQQPPPPRPSGWSGSRRGCSSRRDAKIDPGSLLKRKEREREREETNCSSTSSLFR